MEAESMAKHSALGNYQVFIVKTEGGTGSSPPWWRGFKRWGSSRATLWGNRGTPGWQGFLTVFKCRDKVGKGNLLCMSKMKPN